MTLLTLTVQDSFCSITKNHPLWNHPFLQRCRTGELSLAEIRILAVQMYSFCKEFNRILASTLSCCPDESAQLVILENLFDEMGQGDLNQSHPELFRRFTRALGMSDEALTAQLVTPETRTLIDTYLQIPHKYGYLAAVAAICYASEGIVNSLYSQLYKGIIDTANLQKDCLIFFEIHIDIDDSHAANLARVIESSILTPEAENNIKQAITEAMDARLQFFNGIEAQMSDTKFFTNPWCLSNT
jgi:pyrroloquinoline-quinone synthase